MKILCMITGMTVGGAERVMSTLCNEFSKNNEVRLLILKNLESDYYIADRVECKTGNVKNKNLIKSVKVAKKEIENFKPDVILSFMTKTNIVAIIAKMLSKIKVPVVIAERSNPLYEKKIYVMLRRILYPKADACVFQTKQQQEYYKNIIKMESKVIKNPLSADFNVIPYNGKKEKKIVSVARLYPNKNQKLLINAFSKIVNKYPECKLEFYGDGPEREKLEKQIRKLNLTHSVFLMGRKKNIIEYIKNAEIFVLPSNSEGMPNALLEAMALGIPSIATDCPIGGPAEIIENEKNGLLIKMNNEEEMVNAIERLLNSEELKNRFKEEGPKVVQEFSTEKMCNEWLDYLIKIQKLYRERE